MNNHTTIEPLLTAYLLDDLDEVRTAMVREHIATCDACKVEVVELEETLGLLRQALTAKPTPGSLSPERLQKILSTKPKKVIPFFGWFTSHHPRMARAAAIFVVVACLWVGSGEFIFRQVAPMYADFGATPPIFTRSVWLGPLRAYMPTFKMGEVVGDDSEVGRPLRGLRPEPTETIQPINFTVAIPDIGSDSVTPAPKPTVVASGGLLAEEVKKDGGLGEASLPPEPAPAPPPADRITSANVVGYYKVDLSKADRRNIVMLNPEKPAAVASEVAPDTRASSDSLVRRDRRIANDDGRLNKQLEQVRTDVDKKSENKPDDSSVSISGYVDSKWERDANGKDMDGVEAVPPSEEPQPAPDQVASASVSEADEATVILSSAEESPDKGLVQTKGGIAENAEVYYGSSDVGSRPQCSVTTPASHALPGGEEAVPPPSEMVQIASEESVTARKSAIQSELKLMEAQNPMLKDKNAAVIGDVLDMTRETGSATPAAPITVSTDMQSQGGISGTFDQRIALDKLQTKEKELANTRAANDPQLIALQKQIAKSEYEAKVSDQVRIARVQDQYDALKIKLDALEHAEYHWKARSAVAEEKKSELKRLENAYNEALREAGQTDGVEAVPPADMQIAQVWTETNSVESVAPPTTQLSANTTYYYRFYATNNPAMKVALNGYTPSSTLTNFPNLVVLGSNTTNFAYSEITNATGYDIRIKEKPTGPRFKAFGVNPFVNTVENAFSTFSIDVDTASYTVMRNYVAKGFLPPAEAVRTEEFVNFFDYVYKAPTHDTFQIFTDCAPSKFGHGMNLLKIGVKGRRLGREEQKPSVLTFLIDTSGSMDTPDRLGLVKKSLKLLVASLSPKDKVCIIQYNTHARIVLEMTSASDVQATLAAIDSLECSGSTNLEEAMRTAYSIASANIMPGAENRVLLLSDGVANLGSDKADDILNMVATSRHQGLFCSVLGFGIGTYDDAMLEALANKGDGVYTFIDSEDEAKRVLVDDLSATLNTIAADVKIQVEFNPTNVTQYRQLGYENRQLKKQDFRNDTVDAGEIGSGQAVTALYELSLASLSAMPRNAAIKGDAPRPIATIRVRYRRLDTGKIEEIEKTVTAADILGSFDQADSRFKLAACVAEFSEILRGSPHAEGSTCAAVAEVLRPVAQDLYLDKRVQEFMQIIQSATSLPRGE